MAYVAFPANPNFFISPSPPPPLFSAPPPPSHHPPDFSSSDSSSSTSDSSSSSSDPLFDPLSASFHPSVAIIVVILITMFSLTFLLLLYVKLCKRHRMSDDGPAISDDPDARFIPLTSPTYHRTLTIALPTQARNSGVDKSVVDTLPTFAFGRLQGFKEGLECAVCLCVFESADILRLLPKCKHAFHTDCVGTWLHSHSTCPLCRSRVEADDVLQVDELLLDGKLSSGEAATLHVGRLSSSSNVDQIAADMGAPFQLYVRRGGGSDSNMHWPNPSESVSGSGSRRKIGEAKRDLRPSQAAIDHMDKQQIALRFGHRIIVCSDALLPPRWSNFTPSDTMLLSPQIYRGYTEVKKQLHTGTLPASTDPFSGRPLDSGSSIRINESTEAGTQNCLGESSKTVKPMSVLGMGRSPPSYIRSVSEVTGMRKFMDSCKKPEDGDIMATRWFAIAKRTITQWI